MPVVVHRGGSPFGTAVTVPRDPPNRLVVHVDDDKPGTGLDQPAGRQAGPAQFTRSILLLQRERFAFHSQGLTERGGQVWGVQIGGG